MLNHWRNLSYFIPRNTGVLCGTGASKDLGVLVSTARVLATLGLDLSVFPLITESLQMNQNDQNLTFYSEVGILKMSSAFPLFKNRTPQCSCPLPIHFKYILGWNKTRGLLFGVQMNNPHPVVIHSFLGSQEVSPTSLGTVWSHISSSQWVMKIN